MIYDLDCKNYKQLRMKTLDRHYLLYVAHNFYNIIKDPKVLYSKSLIKGKYPGGNLYFRLDIILDKELSKHTLNTYLSGMKIDPKYVFCVRFS